MLSHKRAWEILELKDYLRLKNEVLVSISLWYEQIQQFTKEFLILRRQIKLMGKVIIETLCM